MFVEANDDCAVTWSKPGDLPVELHARMKPINGVIRPGQEFFLAAMCDGNVKRFKNAKSQIELANLSRVFSRDEGEVIEYERIVWQPDPKAPKKATDRPE